MEFADIYKYKLTLTNTFNRDKEDAIITVRGYGDCFDIVDISSTYRGCELLEGDLFSYHFIEGALMDEKEFFLAELENSVQVMRKGDTIADLGEELEAPLVAIYAVENKLISVNDEE